jgi:hypothetical protein
MELEGVIPPSRSIDPAKVGLPVSVFVEVEAQTTAEYCSACQGGGGHGSIVDAWRMSGDVDYLLHVVVPIHSRMTTSTAACRSRLQSCYAAGSSVAAHGAPEGRTAADLTQLRSLVFL